MARGSSNTDEFGRSRDDSRYPGEEDNRRGRNEYGRSDDRRLDYRHDDRRLQGFDTRDRYDYDGPRDDRLRNTSGSGDVTGDDNRPNGDAGDRLEPGLVIQGRVSRIESYGAFVDFGRGHRGLVHISQLAPHRVEKVEDVVRMDQIVYAVILELEQRRIRLSMRSVNQQTGEENISDRRDDPHQRPAADGSRSQSRFGKLDHRAKQRQELLRATVMSWRSPRPPRTSELLWARSPSPPGKEKPTLKKVEESGDSDSDTTSSESSSSSSSSESSSSSSSEEERRRRRRKRRRGIDRRDKGRRRRSRRRRSPSTDSSSSSSSDSESEDSNAGAKKKSKHHTDEHFQNSDQKQVLAVMDEQDLKDAQDFKNAVQGPVDNSDDDNEEGPMPLPQSNASENMTHASYGGALLPGEGQALAAYVQQNLRIPRRGEIGYTGDDIEKYENQGYVMSGSRHARMNAVRIRKENQVYSAEEQRALALITMEENQQKESQLMQDFRTMLKEKQRIRQQGNDT